MFNLQDKVAAIAFGSVGLVLAVALAVAVMAGKSAGKERDHHLTQAESICAAAGADYKALGKNGKPLAYKKWGAACLKEVQDLVKGVAAKAVAEGVAVAQHQSDQQTKGVADQAHAKRSTDRTRKALQRMEAAENAVQDDNCVGGEWFAGLNDLGGLRGPVGPEGRAPCERDPAQGNTAG